MLIKDMTRDECIELLARARLFRLACAHEGQPYITPMQCLYDNDYLYGFTTLGKKVAWMRENPLVCVLAEEFVNQQNWASVIVLGKYEELSDLAADAVHQQHAYELLKKRAMWWEPGYAETIIAGSVRPMKVLYFRIRLGHISGHRGVADSIPVFEESANPKGISRWFRKVIRNPEHPFHTVSDAVRPKSPRK